jgi:5'-nucleotidase
LKAQGIETIIVLLHEGGTTSNPLNEQTINQCGTLSGPLPPIVEAMDDEIDVVVTGHTNWAVNCMIGNKVVTGAAASGRLITEIDLTISRATKDVMPEQTLVNNRIVTRTVAPDADVAALVDEYVTLAAPLANRVVGSITTTITRTTNLAGESALGDVIADAQLAATAAADKGGAVTAFMNPGGIRADLNYIASGSEGDGNVTYGEAFSVQPFGNTMVVATCTGAQIKAVLEQQFNNPTPGANRVLQIPANTSYTWSAAAPHGSKVSNIQINGTAVDPGASYRVALNNFLATGGDGFTAFTGCIDQLGGEVDLDAFTGYLGGNSPVAPGPQNRITRLP